MKGGTMLKNSTKIEVDNQEFEVPNHWFWKQYKESEWEKDTFLTFKKHLNSKITFIDVGAWVGVTSMYAYKCDCKKIYSIEANPKSFEILRGVKELNLDLATHMSIKNVCITDSDDQIIKFGHKTSSASRITEDGEYSVKTQTILSYLNENRIDHSNNIFLKVDIEGSEINIIRNLSSLIKGNNKMLLALHPPFWESLQSGCETIMNSIKDKKLFSVKGESISHKNLEHMILTEEKFPKWGTSYGNFFEILVIE